MIVTVWPSLTHTTGETLDVQWSKLPEFLEVLPPESLWSPTRFRDGRRANDFLLDCGAIVLDHDAGSVPVSMAREGLKGLSAIVHETKSLGRWRAIVQLSDRCSPDAYRTHTKQLASVLDCAPESASPSQGWFPPRSGACTAIDGEPLRLVETNPRLAAWIAGDYDNPIIRDLEKPIDRSKVDIMIAHAMLGQGAGREAISEVIKSRGVLSHRTDQTYCDLTIAKAQRFQAQSLWAEAPNLAESLSAGGLSRPVITVGPDIDRVADDAARALAALPHVYQRGGALVRIIESSRGAVCAELSATSIGDELSRGAVFVRPLKSGDEKPCEPPERVARILADRREHIARPVSYISSAPIVRPDGSISPSAGYDPITQSVYHGPSIECVEQPTQGDAREALAMLRAPFDEFPFQDPAMVDVVVANLITVVCRAVAGPNTPLFVYDASQKGSGKTLLSTCVSLVALGTSSGLWGWPSTDEELDKRLTSIAFDAQPFVTFDEARNVGGGTLNMLLTGQGQQSFRPLGSSRVITVDWRTVLAVTGNQIAIIGDTRRRTIHVRLTPKQRPADRRFKLDLLSWIPANRERLIAAAINLVRAFILAGSPYEGARMASFENWSKAIAGAIVHAGGSNVLRFTHDEAQGEDDDAEAREGLALWLAFRWPNGATARAIAADLGEDGGGFFASDAARECFQANPGLEPKLRAAMAHARQAFPKASVTQAIGLALRTWRDIETSGLRITGEGKPTHWRTEPVQ